MKRGNGKEEIRKRMRENIETRRRKMKEGWRRKIVKTTCKRNQVKRGGG